MSFGERRTAEELGRAFPGVVVRTSGRDSSGAGVLDEVDSSPALVVSTPGAEPRAVLGHELAHVVQQRAGTAKGGQGAGLAVNRDPGLEAEADRAGEVQQG